MTEITLEVNGVTMTLDVEPRRLLADVLRQEFDLSGVHIGCAHGACGCCTVHLDETPRLSCLTFAVQCDGSSITTVEAMEARRPTICCSRRSGASTGCSAAIARQVSS